MTEYGCEWARERIPAVASGAASEEERRRVDAHLATCDECTAELALVSRLRTEAITVPADLNERVIAAFRHSRRPVRHPAWALAAAALAALALGIGTLSGPASEFGADVPDWAYELEGEQEAIWAGDDETVAGAPLLLEQLSDEALEQLLEELSEGILGGEA